MERFGW